MSNWRAPIVRYGCEAVRSHTRPRTATDPERLIGSQYAELQPAGEHWSHRRKQGVRSKMFPVGHSNRSPSGGREHSASSFITLFDPTAHGKTPHQPRIVG